MEICKELLDAHEKCLDKEPVENTDEVISGKLLWDAVKSCTEQMKYVRDDNSNLVRFLNFIYEEEYHNNPYYYYEMETRGLDVKKPLIGPLKFKKVTTSWDDEKKTALINIYPAGRLNKDKCICIKRDFYGTPEYYSTQMSDFLIRNCRRHFDKILEILKLSTFVASMDSKGKIETVDDNLFVVKVGYDKDYNAALNIKISKTIDKNGDQFKHFYGCRTSMHGIIMETCDQILERTSFNLKSLSPVTRLMVEKYQRDLEEEKKKSQEKTYQKV